MTSRLTEEGWPDKDICPQCHVEFKSVTNHWHSSSTCKFPVLPDSVRDIVYGLISTKGTFDKRTPPKRNRIAINSTRFDKLEELARVLGVFVPNTPIREKENKSGWGPGTNTNYVLHLRPLPGIQNMPAFSSPRRMEYVPNEYFMKAAFAIQGRVNNNSAILRMPKKKAEDRGGIIFEQFFKSKNINKQDGGDFVTYSAPYNDIEDWVEVEWPRGWWNERYLKEV